VADVTAGTLDEHLFAIADEWPGREALVCGDERVDYGKLAGRVRSVADRSRDRISEANRRVAIMLPNSAQYVETLFGTLAAGGVAVPIDPRLRERDLRRVLEAADPAVLVAEGGVEPRPTTVAHGDDADLAMVFLTSGTTGTPKVVRHTHRSLAASLLDLGPDAWTWFTPNPFHTMLGHTVLAQALLGGHRLVTQPAFDPRAAIELVAREQVTVIATSPPLMDLMVRSARSRRPDTSSLRYIGLGGSPVSDDLTRVVEDTFGCPVIAAYGSTELGGYAAVTAGSGGTRVEEGVGSVGADLRVVDEQGRDVPAGQVGELLARGSAMMASYATTGAGGDGIDGDGWFHTGDLAELDHDGALHVVGRKEDLVVRGGDKVSLAEVEQALGEDPSVERVAVVSVDRSRPEIWAYVALRDPGAATAADLHRRLRSTVAPYKVPDRITVVRSLPLTPDGAVQRHGLADLAGTDLLDRHPSPGGPDAG
jgi:long-chain acyl-CoA synthetase